MAYTLTNGAGGTAGSLTSIGTSADTLTLTCTPGATISIQADSANAGNVLVNVSACHAPGDFATIPAGQIRYYRVHSAAPVLTIKSSTGTLTAYIEVSANPVSF